MGTPQLSTFIIVVGCVAVLLGLAEIAVAILRRNRQRTWNLVVGVGFIGIGLLVIWLSGQGVKTFHIDVGPVGDKLTGVLLALFVFGMFILRAAMDIRAGQKGLREENLSQFAVWKSKFQSGTGIILMIFFVLILVVFLFQAFR